jgi:hypothetical protein
MFMLGLQYASHPTSHRPSYPAYRDRLDYIVCEGGKALGHMYISPAGPALKNLSRPKVEWGLICSPAH